MSPAFTLRAVRLGRLPPPVIGQGPETSSPGDRSVGLWVPHGPCGGDDEFFSTPLPPYTAP